MVGFPKAALRIVPALARIVARARGGARRALLGEPTIENLEGVMAPKNRIPLHKRSEFNAAEQARDELRDARLAVPKGSAERKQLLSLQQREQLRMSVIQGAAFQIRFGR